MRNISASIFVIVVYLILTACTTLKRYKSMTSSAEDTTLAAVDLFGFRLSPPKPTGKDKTLWDLGADGQAELVKVLNARYPDNEKFLEAMNFKYLMTEEEPQPSDYVTKDLRLVFSVSRKHDFSNDSLPSGVKLTAADRLEYLKISLEVPGSSPVKFTGWNMYTTEYGSIDIADVSFSRTLELEASAKLTPGEEDPDKAGGKFSMSRQEEQSLKYRYLRLNGRINNKRLEMEEEGTRETDLTGNIIADVSLEFDVFPEVISVISGLRDTAGKFNSSEKLKVKFNDVIIPRIADVEDTLFAKLKMQYYYRNVVWGRKSFPEWDDRVRYYTGTVSKTVPLFTKRDYVPEFFCIGLKSPVRETLIIETSDKKNYALKFRTFSEAADFMEWLNYFFSVNGNEHYPVKIGDNLVLFRGKELMFSQVKGETGFRVLPCYY